MATDWPKHLTCKLTGLSTDIGISPLGKGFNGCSWWSARSCLLEELSKRKPKVLIIAHTEPSRLPNDKNLPLNAMTVQERETFTTNPEHEDLRLAAKNYYKYLMSTEFHIWSQQQWFHELDRIVEKENIPYVVHLHCFMPYTPDLYVFKHGITFDTPLWEISDDIKKWNNSNRNHFTVENNIKLSNIIYNGIQNYSNGIRKLNL